MPLWRWLLLPAVALMVTRQGGVWINGTVELTPTDLRFLQTGMVKSAREPRVLWSIPLDAVESVTMSKGFASETLSIGHGGARTEVKTARAADFLDRINQALSRR